MKSEIRAPAVRSARRSPLGVVCLAAPWVAVFAVACGSATPWDMHERSADEPAEPERAEPGCPDADADLDADVGDEEDDVSSPIAEFSAQITEAYASFDASASVGADAYAWEFGDGSALPAGSLASVTHSYSESGSYTVRLTVTGDSGEQHSSSVNVDVRPTTRITPGPSNTGVPALVTLRAPERDRSDYTVDAANNVTVREDATVIDGLDINGRLIIKADRVVVRNTLIRGLPGASLSANVDTVTVVSSAITDFTMIDSTVRIDTPSYYHANGIRLARRGTIDRVEVSGSVDGIMVYADNAVIKNSWIHDTRHYSNDPNWSTGHSHDDGIQVQGGQNIQILRNHIEAPVVEKANTAVMVTLDVAPLGVPTTVRIEDNLLGGGTCTVNIGHKKSRQDVIGGTIRGNLFYANSLTARCPINEGTDDLDIADNFFFETSPPVPAVPRWGG